MDARMLNVLLRARDEMLLSKRKIVYSIYIFVKRKRSKLTYLSKVAM